MNRVTGDYLETLLYKIFVSMDEQTSVAETASLLQIDLALVKDAVSLYCRFIINHIYLKHSGRKRDLISRANGLTVLRRKSALF